MSVAEQAKCVSLQQRDFSQPTPIMGPSATTDPMPMEILTQKKSQDYEGMSVDENEEDNHPTEFRQILDELANGVEDTSLLRLSEEDVALDEVVMEVEEQEEPSEDDEDSEESDALD